MSSSESISEKAAAENAVETGIRIVPAKVGIDPAFERRTIRKVDLRLLPILGALYSISLIDRLNLSNARISGADADMGLSVGDRYSIITLIFFIPFIVLELPSNLAVRHVGAAYWLSSIVITWGAVMLGMGFVTDWIQLLVTRLLLGILEAGLFPACAYLITTWYIRKEVQFRLAGFYLLSVFASGFSFVLAAGLAELNGRQGIAGWRWIFIVEGAITMALGLVAFFVIVDFPDKNRFLTKEETELVKLRIDVDRGDAEHDPLTWPKIFAYTLDLKLWAFALMYCGSAMPAYGLAFFLPTILTGLGYSSLNAQLMSAPPFVACSFVALLLSYLSDKFQKRAHFIALQTAICIIGLSLTAYHPEPTPRYIGTFFALIGCQGNFPAILAYQANNIVGQSKRAFASALCVSFSGIGGIIASATFRQQDAPFYLPGLWVTISFQLLILLLLVCTTSWFIYCNCQVRSGTREKIEGREGFFYTL